MITLDLLLKNSLRVVDEADKYITSRIKLFKNGISKGYGELLIDAYSGGAAAALW